MHEDIWPSDVHEPVPGLYIPLLRVASGTQYEVAGCVGYHIDGTLDPNVADQARVMMDNLGKVLANGGLRPEDVTRILVFTTQMDEFIATALETVFKWFGPSSPPSTLVGITRLANPRALIEIQATAVLPEGRP